ncbi:M67 family metallopeptidase [Parasphingorhabdus cellanae]|uniref:M67 family metallopeptidase n=2 Tax=Parasphingorhabdus cellanae TaxID=2806553 RepID=A0ABX7T7S7_9SPHN|nr:M67 family metallopeptidase [Parasphingorhabdus cellanae]
MKDLQQLACQMAPEEACGLLFGDNGTVSSFKTTKNVAENPLHHFEINPSDLIAAERAMRDGGPTIIGYFHSHPSGSVSPSKTDAVMAASDGRIWLIIDGQQAAAWRAVQKGEIYGRFNPITLDCHSTNGQTADN